MPYTRIDSPAGFLITVRTYGTWLHGDMRGSVDKVHRAYGSPRLSPDPVLEKRRAHAMRAPALTFGSPHRAVADTAMREVCRYRGWNLRALNIRTNHAHAVVSAETAPERIMGDLKRWATRRLRENGLVGPDAMVWAEHGSTEYLWTDEDVMLACDYTLNRQ